MVSKLPFLRNLKLVLELNSEIMSFEESDLFLANLTYITHIRQNHSTSTQLIATKNNLQKVI